MGRLEHIPVGEEKTIVLEGYYDYDNVLDNVIGGMESDRYYDTTDNYRSRKVSEEGFITFEIHCDFDQGYTDYLKNKIEIELDGEGKFNVVEIEGEKKKLMKGKLKVRIISYIIPEWTEKMDRYPFMSFIYLVRERLFRKHELHEAKIQIMKDRKFLEQQFDKSVLMLS
jgi:hypothetical protein